MLLKSKINIMEVKNDISLSDLRKIADISKYKKYDLDVLFVPFYFYNLYFKLINSKWINRIL